MQFLLGGAEAAARVARRAYDLAEARMLSGAKMSYLPLKLRLIKEFGLETFEKEKDQVQQVCCAAPCLPCRAQQPGFPRAPPLITVGFVSDAS